MIIQDAIDAVSEKFVYTNDPNVTADAWFVMRELDGKFHGDCEDFALTSYWIFCGRSLASFIWNLLIAGNYGLWMVRSKNGTRGDHCVAEINGVWFDNWTRRAMTDSEFFSETGHTKCYRFSKFSIVVRLLVGLRFRNSYK